MLRTGPAAKTLRLPPLYAGRGGKSRGKANKIREAAGQERPYRARKKKNIQQKFGKCALQSAENTVRS